MRQAEEIIHRAVNRVHHPAIFGVHVTGIAFLAEQRDLGKRGAQDFSDELLAAHIQFELDVMGLGDFDAFGPMPVGVHEPAGGARGFDGGGESGFQRNGFHEMFTGYFFIAIARKKYAVERFHNSNAARLK